MFEPPAKREAGPQGSLAVDTVDETLVSVRRDDLVPLLQAAQQLHATPLISAEFHTRLGAAITSVLAALDAPGETAKPLFVDRPRRETR